MADQSTISLARSVEVARRELNNLRRDLNSMKKMFIQKFKEVKELIEKGETKTSHRHCLSNFPWDGPFVPTLQCSRLAHARYIKTLTYLRGFRDKIAIFYNFIVSQIPEET